MAIEQQAVPLGVIQARLAEIDAQVAQLQTEKTMLLRLRQKAVPVRHSARRSSEGDASSNGSGKPGASQAVLGFVREHPGLRNEEIADRLHDKIDTTSKDPRRLVMNTVTNLLNRKKLATDASGGVVIPT